MIRKISKRYLSVFFLVLVACTFNKLWAQTQWITHIGGNEGDVATATTSDLFGNIYTIGTFSGTASFGIYNITAVGKGDVFVTKASASTGEIEWVKQIGAGNEDNGNAIVCDPSGNVYCTGRFSGSINLGTTTLTSNGANDAFLIKLNALTGSVLWAKQMGGSGADGGLSITSDPSGIIYSCGYFQGTANFGTTTLTPSGVNLNMYLLRTDPGSGNTVWAKGFGNSGYTYATGVFCDQAGSIFMTGHFESVLIMSPHTLTSVQYQDIFISKHSAISGSALWAISMGGSGTDNGNAITVGAAGDVYCTGRFEGEAVFGTTTLTSAGSADIFVSKHSNASGMITMVKQLGAGGYEQANAIALDNQGKIYITGQYNGIVDFGDFNLSSAGNSDAFIVKMSPFFGDVIWASGMGGQGVDSGNGITIDNSGGLFCTGGFQSSANIQNTILNTRGANDVFIVKLISATVDLPGKEFLENSFSLAPNPFNNQLYITLNENFSGAYTFMLIDVMGAPVYTGSGTEPKISLDVADVKPGIYFMRFFADNRKPLTLKIVKE